jgi:hypothetical protein
MLSPSLSEEDKVLVLLRAYRGATESRFKGSQGTKFARSLTTIDRNRQTKLLEVAEMLIDAEISPFGWAAFSCDVWKQAGHDKPPRIDWVFLASRVEQRSGWYKSELSDYSGRRLVYGPKATEMLNKKSLVLLRLSAARTQEQAQHAWASVFPGKTFAELLEKARQEGDDERTRLADEVARGNWLWQ